MRPSRVSALALVLVAATILGLAARRAAGRATYSEVQSVLRNARPFAARLSGSRGYQPCALAGSGPLVPRLVCVAGLTDGTLAALASRTAGTIRRGAQAHSSPAALALADLVARPLDRRVRERATTELAERAAATPGDAEALNDFAVALLVRADVHQDPLDAAWAVSLLDSAFSLDTTSRTIRFNQAVALERIGLRLEAVAAWESYLAIDRTSAWADEARDMLRRLQAAPDSGGVQRLRALVVDTLLIRWARALADGDIEEAGAALAAAVEHANEHRRYAGDESASDGVAAVATAVGTRRVAIAQGLLAYDRGRSRFEEARPAEAREPLRQAELLLRDSPALGAWPAITLAAVEAYAGRHEAAERLLARVTAGPPTRATQVGRAHWALGLSLSRRVRWREAQRHFDTAAALFATSGEWRAVGAIEANQAAASIALGQEDSAAAHGARALRLLGASAPLRHSMLLVLADWLGEAGYTGAALRHLSESLRIAPHTGQHKDVAESLVRLARAFERAGKWEEARATANRARGALADVRDAPLAARLDAELAMVEARNQSHDAALEGMARAVAFFEGSRDSVGLLAAVQVQARDALWRADTARAETHLRRGAQQVVRHAAALGPLERRAVFDRHHRALATLNGLRLTRGDTAGALAGVLEMLRANSASEGDGLRADQVLVTWLIEGSHLQVWARGSSGPIVRRVPATDLQLVELATRFTALLRLGTNPARADSIGSVLHALLIAPIEQLLDGAAELVLVPPAPLRLVPFAALRPARDEPYLVERFAIAVAPWVGAARQRTGAGNTVLVGNPSFDRSAFPDLAPLAAADAEVAQVAALVPGATVITGQRATSERLVNALPQASVFHFAGHARSSQTGLSSAFLVVAPGPGGEGVLSGATIARLDLRRMRLAILSACETIGHGTRRGGHGGSLAEAFLAAGAGAVVGSLWEVDDAGSARMMAALHESLAAGMSPASALSATQRRFIREAAPGLWAAFRHEGL